MKPPHATQILSAHAGWLLEHYDGRRKGPYNARWKAELLLIVLPDAGWYVRELKQPVLIM